MIKADERPSPAATGRSALPAGGAGGVALIDAGAWLGPASLAALFAEIPADPYVREGFRHKALSRMRIHGTDPVVGPHEPLYQSAEYNPVHGGIERHYPELTPAMVTALADPLRMFQAAARLPEDEEVLVQAQRITTGPAGTTGYPAVEGFHQDDVDVVGILLAGRASLTGGMTLVSGNADGQALVFAGELRPGQLLVLDDRRVWHYTSPVQDTPLARGHRDVVLFGWPSCRRA
jgi:hypothetical protein